MDSKTNPLLSVLICTIEGRKKMFDSLIARLEKQRQTLKNPDWVEILFECDNKQMPIGTKRNLLLTRASGEYVVFIDDDDDISDYYFTKVVSAIIDASPDCIGYKIGCTFRDLQGKITKTATAKVSNIYDGWHENRDGYDYAQFIYHKNPVLKRIALAAKFPELRFAEDFEYGRRIKPHLKTEYFIDDFLYFYRFTEEAGGKNKRYNIK